MRVARSLIAVAALILTTGASSAAPDLTGITVKAISFKPSKIISGGEVEVRNDRQKDIKFVIVSCDVKDDAGKVIATGGPVINDIRAGTSVRNEFNMSGAEQPGAMSCAITTLFE